MKRWVVVLALVPAVLAEKDGFVPLFNGKDFTGWEYKGSKEDLAGRKATADERVAVEGGLIVMKAKDKDGKSPIRELRTIKKYATGFHLKLEFRASLKSDSGVYIRGPQLQVRDFIRRGEHAGLKKVFKDDDWNVLDIVVKNDVATATVNGKTLGVEDDLRLEYKGGKVSAATLNGKAVDVKRVEVRRGPVAYCSCNGVLFETMTTIPDSGPIGLQAETGKFEFREVRIKEER